MDAIDIGIKIIPLGSAPFGEIVRIYVRENHDIRSIEALLGNLRGCQPLRVGPMEFVTILQRGSEPN